MNATAALEQRESASSSALTEKDEAALIDSFFLPGGILDPDQDEGKQDEGGKIQPGVIATNEWSKPGITLPASSSAAVPEGTMEDAEQRDSFWSTGGQNNSYLPTPAFVPNKEPAWTQNQASLGAFLQNGDIQEGQDVQNLLLNPGATSALFSQDTGFRGSFSQKLSMVPEAEPNLPSLQLQVAPPGFSLDADPLSGALGTGSSNKPPPSAQEQEDVRQMVLALSSSLQNLGDFPDHNVNEHLPRPDSPPKIIRRRTSGSGSNRPNTSISLEFPDAMGSGDNGYENDHLSTTSSLSSGSAYRSESPVQLSSHYRPPETSILAQETSLVPSCKVEANESHPPFATTTPVSVVPPPPGYQTIQAPTQESQIQLEKTVLPPEPPSPALLNVPSPPPPGFSSPSVLPSLSSPSPPKDTPQRSRDAKPAISNQACPPKAVLKRPTSIDTKPRKEVTPKQGSPRLVPTKNGSGKPDTNRRRSTATTITTASTLASPAANIGSPKAAAPASASSRRRRQNRKQSKNRDGARAATVASVAKDKDGEEAVQKSKEAVLKVQVEIQQNHNKKPTKNGVSSTPQRTPQAASKPSVTQPPNVTPMPAIDLARQSVHFGTTLFSCMVQEAMKEALEQHTLAVDYTALYVAPLIAEFMMEHWGAWLPHFYPGIATAAAVAWVCHTMEKDPLLSIGDLSSDKQEEKPSKAGFNKKKKSMSVDRNNKNSNSNGGTPRAHSPEEERLHELWVMEAKICRGLLKNLRWILPTLILFLSITQTSDYWEGLPCLRIVAAFVLSMLKTYNLFSPLSWISASIQILLLLGMRDSNSAMKRWGVLEIVVSSLGLSTLRFIRLGGAVKRRKM